MTLRRSLDRRRDSIHPLSWFLAAVLLWAPVPFASIREKHQMLLSLAAFAALAVAALVIRRRRDLGAHGLGPAAALAALAGLAGLQLVLPPTGALAQLHSWARELGSAPGEVLDAATGFALNPGALGWSAIAWLAAAALLVAAATAGRSRDGRRILGAALLASALFQVIFGAQHLARRSTTIWGREVPNTPDRLRGTFVNPDHCATYLLLALAVVFAWGWWALRRARQAEAPERKVLLLAPPALAWLTLFAGLAFTGSRSALAAALAATTLQGVLAAAAARRWHLSVAGALAAAVGIGFVTVVGLQQGLGRWLATSPYEVAWNIRLTVYERSLELWQRAPWLGFGLGSFRDAFALVSPAGLTAEFWDAHNQYLELLVTGGLAAFVLVAAAAALAIVRLSRLLRRGARSEDRAAAVAAVGALAAMGIHSFFDFGLSMPANAATFVVVVGAALGARTEREGGERGDEGARDSTTSG